MRLTQRKSIFLNAIILAALSGGLQNCSNDRANDFRLDSRAGNKGDFPEESFKLLSTTQIAAFISQFDALDSSMGLWRANPTNREEEYTYMLNTEGAVLDAYLNMYEATRKLRYLSRFVEQADLVLAQRDDIAGFVDWKGESNPVWSNGYDPYLDPAYSSTQFAAAINDGLMIGPMARFAYLMSLAPASVRATVYGGGRNYGSIASDYLSKAMQTWRYHFNWFSVDVAAGLPIGWYFAPQFSYVAKDLPAGKALPLNWMAALGRASIYIAKAGGYGSGTSVYEASLRLCNYTLLEMEYQSDDSYTWRMWPQMKYYPIGHTASFTHYEDSGHAYIDLEFMGLCHRHVGVFYPTEMRRLAKTVASRLIRTASQYATDVTGATLAAPLEWLTIAGYYYDFAPFYPGLSQTLYDSIITHKQLNLRLSGSDGFKSFSRLILEGAAPSNTPTPTPPATPPPAPTPTPIAKRCPWGTTCTNDANCISAEVTKFSSYSASLADSACYSVALDGSLTYSSCLRDAPTMSWIGDFWIFDNAAAPTTAGVACENPRSSSVWTWSTGSRRLNYCARKYRCR